MHNIGEIPKSWYDWFWRTIWVIYMFTKNLRVSRYPLLGSFGLPLVSVAPTSHILVLFGPYSIFSRVLETPIINRFFLMIYDGRNTTPKLPDDQQNPIPIGLKQMNNYIKMNEVFFVPFLKGGFPIKETFCFRSDAWEIGPTVWTNASIKQHCQKNYCLTAWHQKIKMKYHEILCDFERLLIPIIHETPSYIYIFIYIYINIYIYLYIYIYIFKPTPGS